MPNRRSQDLALEYRPSGRNENLNEDRGPNFSLICYYLFAIDTLLWADPAYDAAIQMFLNAT
jgi:hypothetical protein